MTTGELIMTAYSEATLKNSRRIFIIRGMTENLVYFSQPRVTKMLCLILSEVEWNRLKPFHTPFSLIGLNTSKTRAGNVVLVKKASNVKLGLIVPKRAVICLRL